MRVFRYPPFVEQDLVRVEANEGQNYRYLLSLPFVLWPQQVLLVVLKNPSRADARLCDQTVRRLTGYAWHHGFDAVEVANLFAYRATDPCVLAQAARTQGLAHVVGPENDVWIREAAERAEVIIVAWGGPPPGMRRVYQARVSAVLALLRGRPLFYVGRLSPQGNYPLHAQVWQNDMPMYPFWPE